MQPPKDTGVDTGVDAGSRDAVVGEDAGPMDAIVGAQCMNVRLLADNGREQGNTLLDEMATSNYDPEPGCFPTGGFELLYGMTVTTTLSSLTVSVIPIGFDYVPAVHVYRDDCSVENSIGCGGSLDSEDYTATIEIPNVTPGNLAIIVDGDGVSSGPFNLHVDGRIAPGAACDPLSRNMLCGVGQCTNSLCPPVLDCMDSVDLDGDGVQVACTNPPLVTCSPTVSVAPGEVGIFNATATDPLIVSRGWSLLESPPFSKAVLAPPDSNIATLDTDLTGSYRGRFVAYDAQFQAVACETTVNATTAADLFVELLWTDEPAFDFEAFLHVLHPDGATWFDTYMNPPAACSYVTDCDVSSPDWGDVGAQDDPIWNGSVDTFAIQTVRVPATQDGRYSVGASVGFNGLPPPRGLYLNVYCKGRYRQFRADGILASLGLFWQVVNLEIAGSSCTFAPFANPIVSETDAMNGRN